jgi:uncharacterized membrane protein YdbT with pleckstrin-like domain
MRLIASILIVASSLQAAAAAEIYCNAQGRECSDRPSQSVNVPRTAAGAGASGNGAVAAVSADVIQAQRQKNAAQEHAQAALEQAKKEVNKDVSDKRGGQCKQAQAYYQQLVNAQVLNRTGKDGKTTQLSSTEAGQERLSAKLQMDSTCSQAAAQ